MEYFYLNSIFEFLKFLLNSMNPDKPKVLIVEDEAVLAMSVRELMIRYGCDVLGTASNYNDAVKIAGEKPPDLVLMDIRINGTRDGIETASAIKEICNASVIFVTAYSDSATIDRCKKINPSGYLVKPFHENELKSAVMGAISRR